MNGDLIPVLLLVLFGVALGTGTTMAVFAIRWARNHPALLTPLSERSPWTLHPCLHGIQRPESWLAVRGRNVLAVQMALGLHHPKPCSWTEGLGEKLFIAPPFNGWIIVAGSGLPDPADDVDVFFRFVSGLSRKLGHVQFFNAGPVLRHHAWVQAERGRIVRAYAWAGRTLWKQGLRTAAESALGLKCYDYGDPGETPPLGQTEAIATNVEKVPQLAARWSLDPATIDERFLEAERGIAGEPSRTYFG